VTLSDLLVVLHAPAALRRQLERIVWDGGDHRTLRTIGSAQEAAGSVQASV
jgi:hypothetical protein